MGDAGGDRGGGARVRRIVFQKVKNNSFFLKLICDFLWNDVF
jgi:hypothetical protein